MVTVTVTLRVLSSVMTFYGSRGKRGNLETWHYGGNWYVEERQRRKDKYVDMKYYGKNFFV